MNSDSEVKSQVTQDKIETDGETYIKVAPDQTCSEPLVPTEEPGKEIYFDITLEKGVIYNPSRDVGIYGKTVNLGYGVRINGSVYGRDKVELSTGSKGKGPGIVYGDVKSLKDVVIDEPTKKMNDYKESSMIIIGDLVGENIEINSPVIVRGNVLAIEDIEINSETKVEGNIYSKEGTISLEDTCANMIIAGNYEKEDDSSSDYGVDLRSGVTTFTPLIWVKNVGDNEPINLREPVRVLGSVCRYCDKTEEAMDCEHFIHSRCDDFLKLTSDDKIKRKTGIVLTNSWRRVKENRADYVTSREILKQSLKEQREEEKYISLFETDEYGEYVTAEDMGSEITQKIEQNIYGDKIEGDKVGSMERIQGDKVEIESMEKVEGSKFTGSQTVEYVEGDKSEKKEGDKINIGDRIEGDKNIGDRVDEKVGTKMQDSVAVRSNIGDGEDDDGSIRRCPQCGIELHENTQKCPRCEQMVKGEEGRM